MKLSVFIVAALLFVSRMMADEIYRINPVPQFDDQKIIITFDDVIWGAYAHRGSVCAVLYAIYLNYPRLMCVLRFYCVA